MNSLPTASADLRRTYALLAAIWIPAGLVIYLVALQPYATGYLYTRLPILLYAAGQWKSPDWEHCGIVPLACAFILYLEKDRLARIPIRSSPWGLGITLVGLLAYWAGYRVNNIYLGYASIQLLIAGMIVTVLGWQWMRALLFPWLFLIFMWPLRFLGEDLAFRLRLIMSESSVNVLNLIGIPAIRNGTGILSAPEVLAGIEYLKTGERFRLDVADPCSGIRSLNALMMVAALYGYFTLNGAWRRVILFAAAIPLAVLGNLCRILMLTIGVLVFGSEFAIGKGLEEPSWFHSAAGFLVFGVALVGMLGIHKLLEWRPGTRKPSPPESAPDELKKSQNPDAKPAYLEDEY